MNSSAQSQGDWFKDDASGQSKSERLVAAELLNGRLAMLGFVIGFVHGSLDRSWHSEPIHFWRFRN